MVDRSGPVTSTSEQQAVPVALEYRKTATIRASQWWQLGDHPAVYLREALGDLAHHSQPVPWCPTLEGGHVVTPGDWIATGVQGEHWPIKADVFARTYAPVEASLPCKSGEGAGVNPLVEALVYLNTVDPTRIMDDRGNPGLSYTGQQIVNAYKAGFAAAPRTDATQTREAEGEAVALKIVQDWYNPLSAYLPNKELKRLRDAIAAALNARGGA